MVANKALIFKKTPTEYPTVGEHIAVESSDFDLERQLQDGDIILKTQYLSLDPYMRGRMRDGGKSYVPAFEKNAPLTTRLIAEVVKSASKDFPEGTQVIAFANIAEYSYLPAAYTKSVSKLENPHKLDVAHYLASLGMPGLTAYSSFYEYGKPKKGETIFVSAASGAVGAIVCQLAKHEGLTVIGSAGDDKKVEFVEKLGAKCFNYKKEKTSEALERLAPNGIDIYYENVGGDTLDAAINAMNDHGKIVACGMISQYNLKPEERYGVKNMFMFVSKRLSMNGFIVGDITEKWQGEHKKNLEKWLADGSFKELLSVTEGIDSAGDAFVGLLKGKNLGKTLVKLV